MVRRKKSSNRGTGRPSSSEPKIQMFSKFNGCNFELSPRDFSLGKSVYQEQSDLEMNFLVIQNNAGITSNNTIETRNNLETIFQAPSGTFSGAAILIGSSLIAGMSGGSLYKHDLITGTNTLLQGDGSHHWSSFEFADNKLIATTEENQLWTSDDGNFNLSTATPVPNPKNKATVQAHGLNISDNPGPNYPYQVSVTYAYVNKFGPTAYAPIKTFYADYEVEEWNGSRYPTITVDFPTDQGIKAIEFYYTVGNSSTFLLAGRKDVDNSGSCSFNWYGYLDATNMWPVANLIAPTENFTQGPKVRNVKCIDSRVYFWGGDPAYRLYIGGNSGNLFSISPGTGGGFVDVEPGTKQDIRVVTKYKTQSGASIVTMLTNSQNTSKEQRFNLVENSVSLSNEQSMKSWQAEQVAGAIGCKSYNGAIVCEDGLYSVSRYGLALTTMTMEYNSQIQTNYVSDAIKPAFIDMENRTFLKNASILECDGIIYIAFGRTNDTLDNLLFCYDIDKKAWWTISLDIETDILNMIHIDYEGKREGIGIITTNNIYLLPLTKNDSPETNVNFNVTLQTGELSTQQPQQSWFYLSQMEFRFDYFIGSVTVELTGIDQFGRKVKTKKTITHSSTVYNDTEYMRVDLRLQSYQIRITGQARFRLTHFMSKVYPMSSKQGLVWGFDDSQFYRNGKTGDIHPTFKNYNDIRKAIFT